MFNEKATAGDFTGQVVVVTGASSGIGLAAARRFAQLGAAVVLVGRDPDRLDEALSAVRAVARPGVMHRAYPADFARLDDVRGLAAWLRETYPTIDVLANNAGVIALERTATTDGHELTMQVNFLAPFLLSHLLRDPLAGGRIVNTASVTHRSGRLDPADLDLAARRFRPLQAYAASKLAMVLFAAEAARRWPKVWSFAYHPGVVRTQFGRDSGVMSAFYRYSPLLRTAEQGADTLVWLSGAPTAALHNGGYYVNRALRAPARVVTASPDLATRLWTAAEQALGLG